MLSALGAPGVFTAFLVPIRESGSLIPQLVIASYVRLQTIRKWTFVSAACCRPWPCSAWAGCDVSLSGTARRFGLLGHADFVQPGTRDSVRSPPRMCSARRCQKPDGVGSVAGRSSWPAWSPSVVGVLLLLDLREADDMTTYMILLAIAGGLWLLGAGSYALIRELPGATEGGGNAITEAIKRLRCSIPTNHSAISSSPVHCCCVQP
jgi:hypothetical protein